MAKSVSDKTMGNKAQASKAPAKQSSGAIKNVFSRSSSPAAPKQSQGPRGAVVAKPVGRTRTFFREVRIEMS